MAIASSSTSLTGTSHPQNGAIRTLASSNWKALRKTMPAGNVVQDNSSRTSTKRKRDAKVGPTPLAVQAEAEEDTGSTSRTAADGNAKGKGKMQEVSLLSDDTLTGRKAEAGQYVSLDCEFVGIYDPANNHAEHSLARVSIVNLYGVIVLDTFVAQRERIGDWRTWVSGVRPEDVKDAPSFKKVQQQVADILKDRILVGHAVYNDLKVLLLKHPYDRIRDTSSYGPLRQLVGSKRPALRTLAKKALGIDIQDGEHSSVTDARATMAIYRTVQKEWEAKLRGSSSSKPAKKPKISSAPASSIKADGDVGKVMVKKKATKSGKAGNVKGSLGISQTIAREGDWWSADTV